MTALESIISWAESDLPDWQSDAVRRLLLQNTLTEGDRQDLLSMLKALHGLLPKGTKSSKSEPMQKGMVSGAPISKTNVVLKAMKGLRSVNKIPDGSNLPFGHQGLTAIYGENASGKSGYARVLKRACRARDTKERILPNVYESGPKTPAKAKFRLSINGGPEQEIKWEDGKVTDEILTNITVFDSKCARVIVNEKNEVSYLPYGAHVFEELVNVLKWIKEKVEGEKPEPEVLSWNEIPPTSVTGIFLDGISSTSTVKDVKNAASWTKKDTKTLDSSIKKLASLEANDPQKQAAKLRIFKERVTSLKTYVQSRASGLADKQLGKISECLTNVEEAEIAVNIAMQSTFSEEPLPGVGESAWEILYKAAKVYSTTDAYPTGDFPVTGVGSRCVLCMQKLRKKAKTRLLSFKAFIEQTAKKKLEAKRNKLDILVKAIDQLRDGATTDQITNTIDELEQRNKAIATATRSYLSAINARIRHADELFGGSGTGDYPPLPISPVRSLARLVSTLEKEAIVLDGAVDSAVCDNLRVNIADLRARKCFSNNLPQILAHLAGLDKAQKCDEAIASLKITPITLRGKKIVSDALTPKLKEAFQNELRLLGADHLPLTPKPSSSKGETFHKYELEGATSGQNESLIDVLSEGEQRVAALAGFFAEVGLSGNTSTIVLDDPVSSLDHLYREKIAARLVAESQKRQVLVFTHDIAFLLALQDKAGELGGISFTAQTILRVHEAAGIPNDGLPWHAMAVKSRLKYLRDKRDEIKTLYSSEQIEYNKEAALLYALLRETWEAAIEEILLNGTVIRHGNAIHTVRLKKVAVTTDHYKTINNHMAKCSTWMVGHDKSKILDTNRPEPSDLLADIEALSIFVSACNTAGEAVRKQRDAAMKPIATEVG